MKHLTLTLSLILGLATAAGAIIFDGKSREVMRCESIASATVKMLLAGADATFLQNYVEFKLMPLSSKSSDYDITRTAIQLVASLYVEIYYLKKDPKKWKSLTQYLRILVF